MVATAVLGMDESRVRTLVDEGDRRGLYEYFQKLVVRSGFIRDDQTNWAYLRVASYLEDGWVATLGYAGLKGTRFTAQELAVVINRLVSGHRFEQLQADSVGAPWLFADDWPSRGDCAAYVFFVATHAP